MQQLLIILICAGSFGVLLAETAPTSSDSSNSVVSEENTGKGMLDSIPVEDSTVVVQIPLCTLEIASTPAEAAVLLNDSVYGATPLTLIVSPGKHVLILKKSGYYQKKAVLTLKKPEKVSLDFSLSSPGVLAVTTVPDSVLVVIDGKARGMTPFVDSVIKPGTYRLRLEKNTYTPVEDTIEVLSGTQLFRADTLQHTKAYSDSVKDADGVSRLRAKRFTMGIITGAFGLFLLVVMMIEGVDK